jgi:hypothetical protein
MKLAIVKMLIKAWLPGWKLIEPGYHRHKNPEQKKKVWKESTLEDARDMAIEIAKARGEQDAI